MKKESGEFPIKYLKKFYETPIRNVTIKGFTLHCIQAQTEDLKRIWPYLIGERSIKIVRLRRVNLLRLLVSSDKAQKTKKWGGFSDHNRSKKRIKLEYNYQRCVNEFNRITNIQNEYYEKFKKHPMLSVTYEELTKNYDVTVNLIRKFLNIKSPIIKNNVMRKKLKLSEEIKNYHDLKRQFKGSQWEHFFED